MQIACRQETAPFQDEIDQFRQLDKQQPPPKNAILFIGGSTFRLWSDVQQYFPGYTIINRGYGGGALKDIIHYAPDIIFPYHPKQVVIYAGDNDLASSDMITATIVFQRFQTLFTMIRRKQPNVPVVYISIKPSPSRIRLLPKARQVNAMIQNYLKTQRHTAYVDIFSLMLNEAGKPKPELFGADSLHMKPAGYAIWQKALQPYLLK